MACVRIWINEPHSVRVIETRPDRLLGPAVSAREIFMRGCCPICCRTLDECDLNYVDLTDRDHVAATRESAVRA